MVELATNARDGMYRYYVKVSLDGRVIALYRVRATNGEFFDRHRLRWVLDATVRTAVMFDTDVDEVTDPRVVANIEAALRRGATITLGEAAA